MRELVVVDLGTVPYQETLALQRSLVARRARDEIPDVLLLLQHPHVFTFGRRAERDGVRGPDGYEWHYVERGGLGTYHGPGQLVGYPIVKIGGLIDVKVHITNIEEALIRTLSDFGIAAQRKGPTADEKGHTGVWVAPGGAPNFREVDDARATRGAMRKVASIGVAVENWVTFHGFALNVDPDMLMFAKIDPCGLAPEQLVSMMELLGKRITVAQTASSCAERFGEVLEAGIIEKDAEWVYSASGTTAPPILT
ncbi:MAG TPA: lipoyl(octanoyl) transferase LipB [Thermoplasmata archaeon]|nr:lipoyl(octanoyl) transferase LipB [Thermoplasmata archaeon]